MTTSSCNTTYSGDGATTVFPFSFLVQSSADLQVILTNTTVSPVAITFLDPSLYSISGIGNPAGGSVTYPLSGAPLAAGWTLTLRPVVQIPIACGTDAAATMAAAMAANSAKTAEAAAAQAICTAGCAQNAATTAAIAAGTANTAANNATAAAGIAATNAATASASASEAVAAANSITADVLAAQNAATSAGNSATAAAGSANASDTSAANAATSATNAANAAGTAGARAADAATSATNAATSAAAAEAAAAAMSGTSTTALAIGTGVQTFTTQAGKYFNPGTWLMIASAADPANYMHGQVTTYSGTTLTVNVTDTGGSGTHADWGITVSGTRGAEGAQGAQGIQGATGPQGAQGPAGPGSVVSVATSGLASGGPITASGTVTVIASTTAQAQAGTDTTTAMTPAATAAAISVLAPTYPAFRNLLIGADPHTNPWQRGTSFTGIANTPTYTADRLFAVGGASSNISVSKQSGSGIAGFPDVFRFGRAAGNTDTTPIHFGQVVESFNVVPWQGRTLTLSLPVQAGADFSGTNVSVRIITGTGSDEGAAAMVAGTWTGSVASLDATQAVTTTMTGYTFTVAVPAAATELGLLVSYTPSGTAGAADYLNIGRIELDAFGASAFEALPVDVVLARCKRYYQKFDGGISGNAIIAIGFGWGPNSNYGYYPIVLPVEMRTAPVLGSFDLTRWSIFGTVNSQGVCNVLYLSGTSPRTVGVAAGTAAFGHGTNSAYGLFANSTSAVFPLVAEL